MALWAIPVVLIAALIWTFLPHERPAPPPAAPNHPAPAAVAPAPPAGGAAPPPASQESSPPSSGPTPYAEIHQGDLQGTDDAGHQRWRIVADSVTVVQDKETVLLRAVRATFYEKSGGTITVTGARGRFDTKTHAVDIEGAVHGRSSVGRELFADRVRWTPGTGRITGSGHIKLVQERVTMYADEMVSDTTLGQTQFFGHVHAAVR